MQSSFGKEYCEYWKRRETSEATTKAHKRRLDTFLQLNEDTCEGIEAISKNARRKKANNDNTEGNSGSNVDQNSLEDEDNNEAPDNNARNNNAPDNNEDDDITVADGEDLFKEIITTTNKISDEKSTLGDEAFDPIIHADLSFVEVVATHLFEREIQTTSTTKWDGVAFAIKDKKITPVLVEFSGGVKFNTTDKKEQDDETKMVGNILNILKYIEALQMANYPIPQHYIRFFGWRKNHLRVYLLVEKRRVHKETVLHNHLPNDL
ncbi:hypothetical protein G6F71_008669 [Rhizopus microsporus]|nr:hypothetical protein G6F71_008669 [Rhizopus microsporus]KAG1206624.1 hypothetical protein G6F69_008696 [Rhizopus microsporus]KAG1227160.1 hypothetical protein G6F67_008619 [Rhizopus microsporus]